MQHAQLHFPGMMWYSDGEDAGILVVHVDEINAVVRVKGGKPQSLPVKQVFRYRQGDSWSEGRERGVSHHITLERFHECDARILAATAAVRHSLVIGFRFQRKAEPLDSARIACRIELDADNADARKITLRNEPWKQVKLTVRTTGGGRIQNTLGFHRIARLGLHNLSKALQFKAGHRLTSAR